MLLRRVGPEQLTAPERTWSTISPLARGALPLNGTPKADDWEFITSAEL